MGVMADERVAGRVNSTVGWMMGGRFGRMISRTVGGKVGWLDDW